MKTIILFFGFELAKIEKKFRIICNISGHKILILLLFLSSFTIHSQTWQWGKSGGSDDIMSTDIFRNRESVQNIATDLDGNVTICSRVGKTNLQVDGNLKTAYGNAGFYQESNAMIAQFACDGTYRWSKVLGGNKECFVTGVKTDILGNVYAFGKTQFYFSYPGGIDPIHFDTDLILPLISNGSELETDKKSLFIIKYNKNGVFQWLKRPQTDPNITQIESYNTYPLNFELDDQGNSFALCTLVPGIYENGAYINSTPGISFHILKYNSSGVFLGGSPFDFSGSGPAILFQFKRNKNTGQFIIAGSFDPSFGSPSPLIGGAAQIKNKFIACFNANGTFLWKKEGTFQGDYYTESFFDIAFDNQNNIYYSSEIVVNDTFSNGQPLVRNLYIENFLMKLDPLGNVLWQTQSSSQQNHFPFSRALTVNGNEVAITGSTGGYEWGSFVDNTPIQVASGSKAFVARFNKNTGAILDMQTLPHANTTRDSGTAISADANGNYYVGGRFSVQITTGPNVLNSTGGDSDFFLAKFGTSNCSLGVKDNQEIQGIKIFPNPVHNVLFLSDQTTSLTYSLYDIMGKKLDKGTIPALQGEISFQNYAAGVYLLYLEDTNGFLRKVKIIKEM